MRPALVVALLLVVVSSSLATALPTPLHPLRPTSAGSTGSFVCPPGGTLPTGGGVCARSFVGGAEAFTEPDLAISPVDRNVMAIAMNNAQTTSVSGSPTRAASLHTQLMGIFVTRDAGATWTRVHLPELDPTAQPSVGEVDDWDPTIAFDASGTLHVGGIVMQGIFAGAVASPAGSTIRVFHVMTPDLGASWSTPSYFASNPDRPWLKVLSDGTLDIEWWETGSFTLGDARSSDGGVTWTTIAPGTDCYLPSPQVELGGAELTACAFVDPGLNVVDVKIDRYDAATNSFLTVGSVGRAMYTTLLVAPTDGSLVVIGQDPASLSTTKYDIDLTRSTDGGASWSPLPTLRTSTNVADGWGYFAAVEARADPWGNVEITVRGAPASPALPVPALEPYATEGPYLPSAYSGDFQYAFLSLDPATGGVRAADPLTPTLPSDAPSAGVGRSGDFFTIAFSGGHAIVCWERTNNVYYSEWRPTA